MDFKSLYSGGKIYIRGTNETLATSNEFVSAQSLVYGEGATNCNASFGAGVKLVVASASANDTSNGTGARTIVVIGAKGTTGEVISETITMKGQTSVASINSFQLIYCAYAATFGTGLANEGIIGIALDDGSVTNTSGALTTPTPALTIPAGDNICYGAIYMIPPNKRYNLQEVVYGACTQPVVISCYIRPAALGAWYLHARVPVGNVMGASLPDIGNVVLVAGDTIRFDALSTTAAGRVFINAILDRGVYTA